MKVEVAIAEMRKSRAALPNPLGFVPTMGFLHEGHISLVHRAREECPSVGVSIFVNPTQFSENEDLSAYPRDLERDLRLLEAEGVDLVWTPTNDDIYPEGFQTWVTVEQLSRPLEGLHRQSHFRGVATVVAKLFNAIRPDKAYFGQKDAQQVVVIQRMTEDLNFPLEVVVCPTIREPDGLAMSSRNTYLDPKQREAATVIYQSLSNAVQSFEAGERDAEVLRMRMSDVLSTEPLAQPQYISVAHPDTLEELNGPIERALFSMAVYMGKMRLIDNMIVGD
jgi:pantoate--beta-alanine ligase